jgi:hypothetical protein
MRKGCMLTGTEAYWLGLVRAAATSAAAADERLPPAERSRRAERCATVAVDLLTRARLAGYFRAAGRRQSLEEDREFTALRSHEDFQGLLRDIASR